MSCHSFLKNINYVVILKCPKRTLKYYLSKGFSILECNVNNLEKLPNEVKQRIYAEEIDNSEKVITCINTVPSTSDKFNNLLVNKSFRSSNIQIYSNDINGMIIKICSSYVVPLL